MHSGRFVFSQVMDHLAMKAFRRCVQRYHGNRHIQSFTCLDQFLCMAFAQLTFRESLRDIEVCLRAHQDKLYHMGIRGGMSRNTLANANQRRDWRIYAEFAQTMIRIRSPPVCRRGLGAGARQHHLRGWTRPHIDLCLSVFPWALFRSTKSAVKLHTLLDLRGNIPTFIHVSDGKMHDVNVLDILAPEPGAFYIMDRGYVDFERLLLLHSVGAFFIIRAKSNTRYQRRYSRPVDKTTGVRCDQTVVLTGAKSRKHYPQPLRRIKYYDAGTGKTFNFLTNHFAVSAPTVAELLSLPLAGGAVLQVDQAALAHQGILWNVGERGQDSDMDCGDGVCTGGGAEEASGAFGRALHNFAGIEPDAVRENAYFQAVFRHRLQFIESRKLQPVDFVRIIVGTPVGQYRN